MVVAGEEKDGTRMMVWTRRSWTDERRSEFNPLLITHVDRSTATQIHRCSSKASQLESQPAQPEKEAVPTGPLN